MNIRAVLIEFTNGEPLTLQEETVRDHAGVVVPLAEVLDRLSAGEHLYAYGEGQRMKTKDAEPWEDADEMEQVGEPFPTRTLLHIGGIAYASELYDGPVLRVA